MAETYTNGIWQAKPGAESEFVVAWEEFARWAKTMPGCGTLRLVKDVEDGRRFMSFAPWESFEAQRSWKESPEFKDRMGRVQQHVEQFTPSVFELVVAIE